MLFRRKKKSKRDILIKKELKNRKKIQREKQIQEKKEKKEHKKWIKQHKKAYIKKLKKRNPKLYWKYKLENTKLPSPLNLLRWLFIDYVIRGKKKALWGIYIFVANPGEGKTLSMVKHMEEKKADNPSLKIYTNFNYMGETGAITCWQDIVRAEENSIVAIDEAHLTFESTDFKNFPPDMLAQLSLNRKLRKQFLCSTQRYERINKNFRDLANYVVLCKNHLQLDRWFSRYYFPKTAYEAGFDGKKAKAEFIKPYIANDKLYNKYNTLQLVAKLAEEISDLDIKENELLPQIESILEHENKLEPKEVKNLIYIKERIKKQIEENKRDQEKKKIFEKIDSMDSELRKELEKVV